MRRFAAVIALVLLVPGCTVTSAGDPSPGERRPAREFTIDDTRIRVEPAESFTIAVDDNASVGDNWSLNTEPDAGVVTADGDHYVADSDEDVAGGGGTRYFAFTAKEKGTTSVELRNCFRGCAEPDDDHRYEIAIQVG